MATLGALGSVSPSWAQGEPGAASAPVSLGIVTFEGSERYRMTSSTVGRDYIIDVYRIDPPGPPPAPDAQLPVVFVTDADIWSTLASSVARASAMNGQLPSMLVVGIAHAIDSSPGALPPPVQSASRRATDFTPVHDESYLEGVRPFTQEIFGVPWPDDMPLGGADRFLAFIDNELKPFIAEQYPANLEDTTLVGSSLGGLLTLHALFASADSFARYIAISPSAQYGDGFLLEQEERLAADASKHVFIGVGAQDIPEIAEAVSRLHARIEGRSRPNLKYDFAVFEGATHESIFPGGLMAGLRFVFEAPTPSYVAPGGQR